MKLLHWSCLRTGLLAFSQAVMTAVLCLPWLQLALPGDRLPLGVFWVVSAALMGIATARKTVFRGREGLPAACLGIAVLLVLVFVLGLNPLFFIPLTLVLLLMGIRFTYYPKRARFAFDWTLGSMLLIISASLAEDLAVEVSALSVLLYFVLGIASLILWNAAAEESYRGLGRSIAMFVLIVGGISLVLGMVLSPAFFQGFMALCRYIYSLFADLVMLLFVRPLAWILSPLFRWVENLELQEVQLDLPGDESLAQEQLYREDIALSPGAAEAAAWIGWAVFVGVLFLVLWRVLRRLLRRSAPEQGSAVRESRESVFSGSEVLGDLKGVLSGLLSPIRRLGQFKRYRGNDPVLVIRSLYSRFSMKAGRRASKPQGSTPREYAQFLADQSLDLDLEAVEILTDLYNAARYGELADGEDANCAERAFKDIWH
jgi:hypothetical protein